ncbi:hypothetical protein ACFPRL_16145 [Pseudoclavibacter helvolus]
MTCASSSPRRTRHERSAHRPAGKCGGGQRSRPEYRDFRRFRGGHPVYRHSGEQEQ